MHRVHGNALIISCKLSDFCPPWPGWKAFLKINKKCEYIIIILQSQSYTWYIDNVIKKTIYHRKNKPNIAFKNNKKNFGLRCASLHPPGKILVTGLLVSHKSVPMTARRWLLLGAYRSSNPQYNNLKLYLKNLYNICWNSHLSNQSIFILTF